MNHSVSVPFDGLLNFFKPVGMTSARALDRVRRLTGIRKSGHAGTLDPGAEGVLLICMGRATKSVELLMNLPKRYCAGARLDVTSGTLDCDSELQAVEVATRPTLDNLLCAADSLSGCIQQVPPKVSAIKVDGKPAYKRVRHGESFELAPRPVTVYSLTIQRYQWPELDFEVCCGRGTYVRALIRDLGQFVGTGGCLTRLKRIAVGPFDADAATTLEDLEAGLFEQRRISLERMKDLVTEVLD